MVNKKKLIMVILVVAGFFVSCTPQNSSSDIEGSEKAEERSLVTETRQISDPPSAPVEAASTGNHIEETAAEGSDVEGRKTVLAALHRNSKLVPAPAHAKYVQDEVDFTTLQDLSEYEQTAVIGSRVALFYPEADLKTSTDLDTLPQGTPLPISTIIPILGRVKNEDRQYYGFFFFQNNYNFFYKTEWEGRPGLVFGADLVGTNSKLNAITSRMYKSPVDFEQFSPFTGFYLLSDAERAKLKSDRIAFQEVSPSEYSLSLSKPDDMISLYMDTAKEKQTPLFITTDLIANGLHLFFDKFLQYSEETYFMPRLDALVDAYIAALKSMTPEPEADDAYAAAYRSVLTYFSIADCLIALAPTTSQGDQEGPPGSQITVYEKKDQEQVLSTYPEEVQSEVSLILAAAGPQISPNFHYNEDYTQYKPRGHYTKNGVLEAYFRTMMWFGRLHMYISTGNDPVIGPAPQDSAEDLSLQHLPMVAIIETITASHQDIYDAWKALFYPVTDLIGASDDLSFKEIMPFFDSLKISDLVVWIDDVNQLKAAIRDANETLKAPLISGNSVFEAPSSEGRKQPLGWRLFGQRFTYDSYIHQQVSPPRLMSRDIVRGLDVMKAFGSESADQFLAASDYPTMVGLEERLDELEAEFDAYPADFWQQTYYNAVLDMIRSQALFEPGSGFFFTETPMWAVKSELSAHGTWAALRHDTILYVKQVYAERAGDGDYNETFRTEPLPQPVHYIEPNRQFFKGARSAVNLIAKSGKTYQLIDEQYERKIASWQQLLERMKQIVDLEYVDEQVSAEDVAWIRTIPQQLVPLVQPPGAGYASYAEDDDALKGAIVADVFTNAEAGTVLEVGLGIPYRIYVCLNDGQGGKRVAVGYTFSYYEFPMPQDKRMTNEEWRAMVYAPDFAAEEHQPFWSRGVNLAIRADQ
ncbi:DUF3160 domain-containing protein [Sediminispirochaeta smaragdinae]|uniref:DUF3160 domain-containing protein n=1 Tax=Sediminispirochaeta smaragdinae TaxID=55206 RepID=UPI0002DD675F|nr:DUF3160 domain-containing protein [Sediminispirochaeta smaragdinae]